MMKRQLCFAALWLSFVALHAQTGRIIGLKAAYAFDDDPFVLRGLPAGGVFSGRGLKRNAFYPAEVGCDNNSKITYIVNIDGRPDTTQATVRVDCFPWYWVYRPFVDSLGREWSNWEMVKVYLKEPVRCPDAIQQPPEITAFRIMTANSTEAWWKPPGGENVTFTLRYRKEGARDEWTELTDLKTNRHNVTGLERATAYEFQVMTFCPGGYESDWSISKPCTTMGPLVPGVYDDPNLRNAKIIPLSAANFIYYLETKEESQATVTVYDLSGRTMLKREELLLKGRNELPISLDKAPDGIYLLQIRSGEATRTIKLIVPWPAY